MDITSEMKKNEGQPATALKDQIKDKSTGLHDTIDHVADSARPTIERATSGAHAGVDQVSSALTDATHTLAERTRDLSEAYERFAETGRRYVRMSPVMSISIAMVAGYLIAKLGGGRDRDR
ncbi:hypothetical protein [Glaciimonas immobilis]|uniref:ElaB/YqjD/DUF883 family membrane-anchored ribosome-binding protein n=1 Tax=Glaciimonas immobilis TaxID=728004 RepID=A0A840RWL3_9BURK|nr:hypothetical protein [Glaciimonas immobilis]KAF3997475.1 hypothetical protein HAV38_12405 [Glaciimonas immobilis]MBB5200850.1 ElaB/YqjD/DUF883 family membrane-anchored ribosome-binding protein [Glaciimonas immobilis]